MADCHFDQSKAGGMVKDFAEGMRDKMAKMRNASSLERRCPPGGGIFCIDGSADKKGTCVEALRACFDSLQDLEDFRTQHSQRCGKGPEGEQYKLCDRDGCVAQDEICTPVARECPADKPLRCPNWRCAKSQADCAAEGGHTACAVPKVVCPDGSCKKIAECARNMTWQGCPGGMVECRQRKGLCVDSIGCHSQQSCCISC